MQRCPEGKSFSTHTSSASRITLSNYLFPRPSHLRIQARLNCEFCVSRRIHIRARAQRRNLVGILWTRRTNKIAKAVPNANEFKSDCSDCRDVSRGGLRRFYVRAERKRGD